MDLSYISKMNFIIEFHTLLYIYFCFIVLYFVLYTLKCIFTGSSHTPFTSTIAELRLCFVCFSRGKLGYSIVYTSQLVNDYSKTHGAERLEKIDSSKKHGRKKKTKSN